MICKHCKKKFIYDREKGHRKFQCLNCLAKQQRYRKKNKAILYKGGKCNLCGYSKCNRALSFHHRSRKGKKFDISDCLTLSWKKMKKEIDKCDLLCANCHMELEDSLVTKIL